MTSLEEQFSSGSWRDFERPGNYTYYNDYDDFVSTHYMTVQAIVFVLLFIVGVPGNILVLRIFTHHQNDFRLFISNILTLSLATADLGVLVVYIPFYLAYEFLGLVWPFGSAMCKLVFSVTHICVYASLGTMIAIAGERYLIVRNRPAKRWVIGATVGCVWSVAIILCVPQLMYYTVVSITDDAEPLFVCELEWPDPMHEKILHPIDFTLFYLFPLIFTAAVYLKIIRLLRAAIENNVPSHRLIKESKRIVRLFVVTLTVFAICVLPIHILHLCRVFYHDYWLQLTIERPGMFPTLAALYLVTHVANPFIYILFHRQFRVKAGQIVRRCLKFLCLCREVTVKAKCLCLGRSFVESPSGSIQDTPQKDEQRLALTLV
ncbi:predicted protein [Nematostella vectensis]|uniref:G-protein coupled receptors family 1 profile domain-containing protein n=2 Tax=Nematostella vectensis TaxID=45351 RepID=A7RJ64_NEMVE|nr:predicted protein [Nematostella vectensis]|eukprot:XP_001640587.1 predicted protein [Nematostella vectensis]